MKLPLLLAIGIFPLVQLFAQSEAVTDTIWDFTTKSPTYGYEGWEDLGSISLREETGWSVDAPANGGFGIFFPDLLDLENASKLHVKVIPNSGNSGDRLMLKFHAADGKQAIWYLPMSDLDTGVVSDVTIDLANPDDVLQEEPIDMGIIRQIQVQGTFTPGSRVNVTFVSLDAEQK